VIYFRSSSWESLDLIYFQAFSSSVYYHGF
jgi:hypothetical protein